MRKMGDEAMEYYFSIVEQNYCRDFIDYYDIGASFGVDAGGSGFDAKDLLRDDSPVMDLDMANSIKFEDSASDDHGHSY